MPPLLPYAIALIAGILLQGSGISAFFMLVPLAGGILLLILHKHTFALFTLTVLFGWLIATLHAPERIDERLTEQNYHYSGIIEELREHESSRSLIVLIDSCGGTECHPFLTKLFVPSTLPVAEETDRVQFTTTLSHLTSGTEIPDEIDYNAPLVLKGVVAEAAIHPDSIHVSGIEPGFLNSITRYRKGIITTIAATSLSAGAKTFLITTLTGDKSFLTADTREMFSSTGIAHVLALSGMHVGILTWVIFIMLLPLQLAGIRNIRISITIILLWLFAIVTGLSPSVVRAVIMATLLLLGALMQRVHSPFNALAFAAIMILIFTPHALYTIGFQLTFIAVATILLTAKKLNPFPPSRRIPYMLTSYLTVSISAMLGTGIVSAYYFGIFPVYFLVTNVVISFVLPLLLGGGVILTLLSASGISSPWLESALDGLYSIIEKTASAIARLPGAHIDGILMDKLVIVLYFAALAMLITYLHRRRKVWIVATAAISATALAVLFLTSPAPHTDMLFIPKSSQSTSIFIKENNKLWFLTTAHPVGRVELKTEYEHQYGKFMSRCRIDSITLMPERYSSRTFSRNKNLLKYNGRKILIINSSASTLNYSGKIDYAVVCKGFRGDIADFASTVHPDTLILSTDIHKRRHDRYVKELTAIGQPLKELRKNVLILTAE